MRNSRSPTNSLSFLSDSTSTSSPKSSETINALSNHQLKKAQDLFDGLLNYVYCTNDAIIEIANQIERNCSTAELLIETLKSQKVLIEKSKINDSQKILIQEKSPLGKRPNPYIDQLDKENLNAESIFGDSEDSTSMNNGSEDSIDAEEYDDGLSTSTSADTVVKSYQDQQTQTSPAIPIQNNFQGPVQYFLWFSLPAETGHLQKNGEISPSVGQGGSDPHRPLIFVQPVYFIQPQQIQNSLPRFTSSVSEMSKEIRELEQ